MTRPKLPVLLAALLLRAASGAAQSTQPAAPLPAAVAPPTDPAYEEVRVPVPRAVALLVDVGRVIFSRNSAPDKVQDLIDKRRARSERRDQTLTVTVPKNKFTRSLGLVE